MVLISTIILSLAKNIIHEYENLRRGGLLVKRGDEASIEQIIYDSQQYRCVAELQKLIDMEERYNPKEKI